MGAGVFVGNRVGVGSDCSMGAVLGALVRATVGAAVGLDAAVGNAVGVGYGVYVGSGVYVGNAVRVAGTAISGGSELHPRSASATLTKATAIAAVLNRLISNTSGTSDMHYR